MKLLEIKGTRKSIEVRISELNTALDMKYRVLRGGNSLSPGERKNMAAWKQEIIQLKKQLKSLTEAEETDDVDNENNKDTADQEPTEEDDEHQDVGSVADQEGFVKSKKEMYAFGATRPVTLLTKNQKIGGLDVTLQYVINPKTGAWSLRACLEGQTAEDMVEFNNGEDPTSLVKNLKKKTKVTPHQLVDNLNPPADKVVKPVEKEDEKITEGMGAMDVATKTNLRYCSPVIAFDDDNKWYVEYCLYGKNEKPKTEGPFKSEAAAKMRSNALIVQHMKNHSANKKTFKESSEDKLDKVRAEILSKMSKGEDVDISAMLRANGFVPGKSVKDIFGDKMTQDTKLVIARAYVGKKVILHNGGMSGVWNPDLLQNHDYPDFVNLMTDNVEVIIKRVGFKIDIDGADEYNKDKSGKAIEIEFIRPATAEWDDLDGNEVRGKLRGGEMWLEDIWCIEPVYSTATGTLH